MGMRIMGLFTGGMMASSMSLHNCPQAALFVGLASAHCVDQEGSIAV